MIDFRRGDAKSVLEILESNSIDTCITSPPYWGLRDYGVEGQLGLEKTPEEYVNNLCDIFDEVYRVLKKTGTLWLNLGDTYNKGALQGIPWMVAFELKRRGWILRQDIIWAKPNPMPESVKNRCTKSHEHIFILSKSPKYYFDFESIKEPAVSKTGSPQDDWKFQEDHYKNLQYNGQSNHSFHKNRVNGVEYQSPDGMRRKRDVWNVSVKPFKEAHFATFPPDLIEPCVLAGCPEGGTTLDPFGGAGTTALVSKKNNRNNISIELNQEYIDIAKKRLDGIL